MSKKKELKHPKDMTTEEAIKHLFTHRGARHIKKQVDKLHKKSNIKEK